MEDLAVSPHGVLPLEPRGRVSPEKVPLCIEVVPLVVADPHSRHGVLFQHRQRSGIDAQAARVRFRKLSFFTDRTLCQALGLFHERFRPGRIELVGRSHPEEHDHQGRAGSEKTLPFQPALQVSNAQPRKPSGFGGLSSRKSQNDPRSED